eukprot:3023749-Alexandrium_andersonii.AAC.1
MQQCLRTSTAECVSRSGRVKLLFRCGASVGLATVKASKAQGNRWYHHLPRSRADLRVLPAAPL